MLRTPTFQKLVVSIDTPHYILATETGVEEILHFSTDDLRRQTIGTFEGPRTDTSLFRAAIQKAGQCEPSKFQIVLYDRYGQDQHKMVTFSPYHDSSGMNCACMITIEDSEAILLHDAVRSYRCAHALVSVEGPYHLQMINEEFSRIFGFTSNDIPGQSMNIIQSQKTDILRWCTMFQTACEGQLISGSLCLCTRWCIDVRAHLTFTPVVESPNGKVAYVLIQFDAPEELDGFVAGPGTIAPPDSCESHPSSSFESSSEQGSQVVSSHGPFADYSPAAAASGGARFAGPAGRRSDESPAAAAATAAAALAPRERRAHCPKIYPRRKAHEPKSDLPSSPIVITLELLDTLSDIPLYRAAERIGVSATALKLACRKLGVRKWQCRRRGGGAPDPEGRAGSVPGSGSDVPFDGYPPSDPVAARRRDPPPPLRAHCASCADGSLARCSPARSAPAAFAAFAFPPEWLPPGPLSSPGAGSAAPYAAAAAGAAEAAWAMAGAVEQPELDVPSDLNDVESAADAFLPPTPRRPHAHAAEAAAGAHDFGLLGECHPDGGGGSSSDAGYAYAPNYGGECGGGGGYGWPHLVESERHFDVHQGRAGPCHGYH